MNTRSLPMLSILLADMVAAAFPAFAADEFDQVAEAANRLAASGKPVLMTADRLHSLLTDADPSNDPFLVSVCASADYAKAHIKDSINIPRGAFRKPANLAKLPPKDKPIVAYCYTGTGAVGPATALNLMGDHTQANLLAPRASGTRPRVSLCRPPTQPRNIRCK